MPSKEFVIKFYSDGTTEIEGFGFFEGSECLEAAKPFEAVLGINAKNSIKGMKPNASLGRPAGQTASRSRVHI
jgi:hypothetical protein